MATIPLMKFDDNQSTMLDFKQGDFLCLISGLVYETKRHHDKLCIYKYCKRGWKFGHDAVHWNNYKKLEEGCL